jgi:WD40 repeat protein
MEIDIPISAVDSYFDEKTGLFLLLIGDEKGEVKIQDISIIIKHYKLRPIDIVAEDNNKRNPNRFMPIERVNLDNNTEDGDIQSEMEQRKPDPIPELDEGKIKQIYAIHQAHKDVIKSIAYIAATDVPLIFTAGLDRMAKIWDMNNSESPRGILQQGYMLNSDYKWDFPLSEYSSFTESRQNNQMDQLREIRAERDQDRTYKK